MKIYKSSAARNRYTSLMIWAMLGYLFPANTLMISHQPNKMDQKVVTSSFFISSDTCNGVSARASILRFVDRAKPQIQKPKTVTNP